VIRLDRSKSLASVDMNDPLAGRSLECAVVLKEFDTKSSATTLHIDEPIDVPAQRFTLAELRSFNGVDKPQIYVSLCGYVYDVSSADRLYGRGGMYHFIAGHDGSVALGKFKIDPSLCNKSWNSLDVSELKSLAHYVRTFLSKYPVIGKLSEQWD